MKEFKNKIAVVTGAASGIGRGMAETFAAAGMKVILSDIDHLALKKNHAIRDERFYILTHPDTTPAIEQRVQDILKGNNPTPIAFPGIESLTRKLNALKIQGQ